MTKKRREAEQKRRRQSERRERVLRKLAAALAAGILGRRRRRLQSERRASGQANESTERARGKPRLSGRAGNVRRSIVALHFLAVFCLFLVRVFFALRL